MRGCSRRRSHRAGRDHPALLVARYERVRRTAPDRGQAAARVRALARHAGRRCRGHQRPARRRQAALPERRNRVRRPAQEFELFAAEPHCSHAAVEYRRGGLRERLAVWDELQSSRRLPGLPGPRSRLAPHPTRPAARLRRGSLPPLRKPLPTAARSDRHLPDLAAAWAQETLGVRTARSRTSPLGQAAGTSHALHRREPGSRRESGQAPARPVRSANCSHCSPHRPAARASIGAPAAKRRSASSAPSTSPARAPPSGKDRFAGFARVIAGSSLYVGYDSAGQHVAAACGVPLISIFAGFPAPRMFHRWRPPARTRRNPRGPSRSRRNPRPSGSRAGDSIVRSRLSVRTRC